jgi:hypothetical protein
MIVAPVEFPAWPFFHGIGYVLNRGDQDGPFDPDLSLLAAAMELKVWASILLFQWPLLG